MAQVAANADDYAVPRVGIFFPGVTPDLDGQCVSLVKWFMQEMSEVPNPQAARGDARYVGQTLVAQGLAVEVPYEQRRRGDIICYEYGKYGHIAVQLGGGNVFEENVNMPGTSSQLVDGAYVYSARVGSEAESWRATKNPHIYRLTSYKETGGSDMDNMTEQQYDALARRVLSLGMFLTVEGSAPDRQPTAQEVTDVINGLKSDPVAQLDYLLRTTPYGMAWNKVKHYNLDVAAAAAGAGNVTPYSGAQLFVKNKQGS